MKAQLLALIASIALVSCKTSGTSETDKPDVTVTSSAASKEKPKKEKKAKGYKASIKKTKKALTGSSNCDACVKIGSWIIVKVGCGAGEVALDAACTAAEIAFFEFDEIIAPLCTALEIGLPVVCEEMGSNWVKEYPDQAARKICETCKLCP
jgi:hypothetical protein